MGEEKDPGALRRSRGVGQRGDHREVPPAA
jgi:hypothetical protein